jgi:hypothetical protein
VPDEQHRAERPKQSGMHWTVDGAASIIVAKSQLPR